MQPLDLGLGQPRLGVQLPCESGQPPRVTCVVGGHQLCPECFQVITGHVAGVTVLLAAGLAWTARLVHIGHLDAYDLADKLSVPAPVSALDWPELHLNAVVAQPDEQPVILLHVDRPAHPQRAATLLLALDRDDRHSLPLLSQWCADQAPVSPARRNGSELTLRRRQSLQRVHAVLVAEDTA
jgi:hypothetical protein